MLKPILSLALLFALTAIAQAHPAVGVPHGFVNGVAHPLSGIDHILAMVAVGMFAAHLGGRALWLVPVSFVAMMIVGGALGVTGVKLPLVEMAIGFSVVALGAIVAFRLDMANWMAMAVVGFFALFHGHSHGTEMPQTVSGLAYGAGFVLATAFLHLLGIGLGLGMARHRRALQVLGGAIAAAGVAIVGGYF
jgi:urease accessory protein